MTPPKLEVKAVPVLADDELRALIAACKGPRMMDKRDEALIRFMAETGEARHPDVKAAAAALAERRAKTQQPPGSGS